MKYEVIFKSGKIKNVISKDVNKIKNYITESFNEIKSYKRLDEMASPSIAVMLKHAGFIRKPEEDFRDNGTSFKIFEYKGMPVSVATSNDEVFVLPRADEKYPELDYDELSSVPSYRELDEFNGVDKNKFNVEKLKKNIETYISEMDPKVGEFTSQSIDIKPIIKKIDQTIIKGKKYLESIKNKIGEIAINGNRDTLISLSRYIEMLKDGLKRLDDKKNYVKTGNRKTLKYYSNQNFDAYIQDYINDIEKYLQ